MEEQYGRSPCFEAMLSWVLWRRFMKCKITTRKEQYYEYGSKERS